MEFAVLGKSIRTFTVERGSDGKPSLKTHTVEWDRKALEKDVAAFREQLSARDLSYRTSASALYRKLMGPAADELRGKSTIVLVPDGALWNLPFQALVRPDGAHMLERQTIFYTPSLTFLRHDRQAAAGGVGELLAMGNLARPICRTRRVVLLARFYDARAHWLTGAEATRPLVTGCAQLSGATWRHGVLNVENPMYSGWRARRKGCERRHAGGARNCNRQSARRSGGASRARQGARCWAAGWSA